MFGRFCYTFTLRIVKTIRLGGMDYENFVTDLLADRAFLENVPGCGEDGPLVRCLCVTCRGRDSTRTSTWG